MTADSPNSLDGEYEFISYVPERIPEELSIEKSDSLFLELSKRRSVRYFSSDPVPREAVINAIKAAATAPSGANKQPWVFCLISNLEIKRQIRLAAEEEERKSYSGRMSDEWLRDLEPLGTGPVKPYLEEAPYIIAIFKKSFDLDEEGNKSLNYYVNESVGIAAGFLLVALHNAGLATLTHTPSPMDFLGRILNRPKNEKPYLLLPVGYPHENSKVPKLEKKPLSSVLVEYNRAF